MFDKIYESLNQASLFELFRLKDLVDKLLDNPVKLKTIRNQLHVQQAICYFDPSSNQDIEATILKVNRTNVFVKNKIDGLYWTIPMHMINLQGIHTELNKHHKIDKLTLKVGDSVGFLNSKTNQELYGVVTKLNPKTASVHVLNNSLHPKWRVSYSCLFYVLDTTIGYLELA